MIWRTQPINWRACLEFLTNVTTAYTGNLRSEYVFLHFRCYSGKYITSLIRRLLGLQDSQEFLSQKQTYQLVEIDRDANSHKNTMNLCLYP